MNTRLLAALALSVLSLLSACGGSAPKTLIDKGSNALNSGDYEAAAKSFDQALAALGSDTSNPEWLRAKLGVIQAHTRTDAAKAQTEFLELATANPSKITDRHFSQIGGRLGDAGHTKEAMAVVTGGLKAHAKSP